MNENNGWYCLLDCGSFAVVDFRRNQKRRFNVPHKMVSFSRERERVTITATLDGIDRHNRMCYFILNRDVQVSLLLL